MCVRSSVYVGELLNLADADTAQEAAKTIAAESLLPR